jgi:GntR family transcriptional regulator / MocR family aminotransferase
MELPIELDASSNVPLHRQLYEGLRGAIVNAQVAPGTRLPSTRALAEALGVSRSTIISSFAQLHSEGYLQATTGSGTFVSNELPEGAFARSEQVVAGGQASIRLSTYGASLAEAGPLEAPRSSGLIDFRDGRPPSLRPRGPTVHRSTTAPMRRGICRCVRRLQRIWAGPAASRAARAT